MEETYRRFNNVASMVLIAGDMNSKVGVRQEGESFVGRNGKGTRNSNGARLSDFLAERRLYFTNTTFRLRIRNIPTWHGKIKGVNI